MALNGYLRIESDNGPIEGSAIEVGQEGKIEVWAVNHEIAIETNVGSGQATGRRQHRPLRITKPLDKASPLLMDALVNNRNLLDVELQMYRTDDTGAEEHYYTIVLQDATVSNMRVEMLNNRYNENAAQDPREHVSFVYSKIQVTYVPDGISAEDDWAAAS